MALPALIALTVYLARVPAYLLSFKENKNEQRTKSDGTVEYYDYGALLRHKQSAVFIKSISTLFLIQYPGLCKRLFTVFKCKQVAGLNHLVMAYDFNISCEDTMNCEWITFCTSLRS